MSSEIRICPNCGAGVVGNTPNCPRCDFPLTPTSHPKDMPDEATPQGTLPDQSAGESESKSEKAPPLHDDSHFEAEEPVIAEPSERETRIHTDLDENLPIETDDSPAILNKPESETPLYDALDDTSQHQIQIEPEELDELNEDQLFENAQTAEVPKEFIGASGLSETQPSPPPAMDEQQAISVTQVSPPQPQQSEQAQQAQAPTPPQTPIVQPPLQQHPLIPPAPYTPPPLRDYTRSVAPYSYPSNYYLEQRIAAYRQGGYELISYTPYQVTLAYGKPLGFFWWLVAMMSVVGLVWYFLILLTSGFSRDKVFLIVERDGTLYEDGAGAAHVRRQRAKVGRRWGFLGVVIFFVALLWFIGMSLGAVWGIANYRAELEAAYPTITLFQSNNDSTPAESIDADTVANAESIVLAFSISFVLSFVCLLAGLNLTIVGYLHSQAYDVKVIPIPG